MRTAQVAQVMPATSNRMVSAAGARPESAEYGVTLLLDGLLDRGELDASVVVGNPHRGVGNGNLHRLHPIERADRSSMLILQ